jgi:hypothetical protein
LISSFKEKFIISQIYKSEATIQKTTSDLIIPNIKILRQKILIPSVESTKVENTPPAPLFRQFVK